MRELSQEQIAEMRSARDKVASDYSTRDALLEEFDEIYFMNKGDVPVGMKIDEKDIKKTISSSGHDAVVGMNRILNSGEIHIEVEGKGGNPDKVEAGLKRIIEISGRYKISSVKKDLIFSASLHGTSTLMVESVADLMETHGQKKDGNGYGEKSVKKNEYVINQLKKLQIETPFLLHTVNARQSYPVWGAYGQVGHLRKYTMKGTEIHDRWGVECDSKKDYEVTDFFYYEMRLVEAQGIKEPLFASEWVARDEKTGEMIGSLNIPVFTRFSGGSSLFTEPEKQSHPLLYAKAQGKWHKRENLFWTWLFTAIDQNGLPGPILLVKPDSTSEDINIEYRRGLRIIRADGQMADPQVIDGDVMRLKEMMDSQAAMQTIQPQTLGANTSGVTFSQFALASKAGLIPAVDPKEAIETLLEDACTHMLERIKAEDIQNELITPADIPEGVTLTVTLEPDLEQDDLRNSQVAQGLLNAGANVSKEWINTNILKIPDSKKIWRQKKLEELEDTMIEQMKTPEFMGQFLQGIFKPPQQSPNGQTSPSGQTPPNLTPSPSPIGEGGIGGGVVGMEQMPKTDAMIPQEERR